MKIKKLLNRKVTTLSLSKGFTLIELLIVISILGILATLLITNVAGARLRAQDAKKKSELNSLKTALQLYYNKYQTYPASNIAGRILGCGQTAIVPCDGKVGTCSSALFAAGGADGCETVFMQRFDYASTKYSQCSGGDDYRAKVLLSNSSDPDIAESQLRCPSACGATTSGNYYFVCPN